VEETHVLDKEARPLWWVHVDVASFVLVQLRNFSVEAVFDLSEKQWGVERQKRENRGAEGMVWEWCVLVPTGGGEWGLSILPNKFFILK